MPHSSNQHLPSLPQELMHSLLDLRRDHLCRPPAMGTGQPWRRSEQTADQRSLRVDLAPLVTQVRTTQVGQCRLMLFLALDRQPCHLLAGSRYRPAAIVTAGDTLEGGNALAKKTDLLVVSGHEL